VWTLSIHHEAGKDNQSPVALQAVQRIAWIYRIEREVQSLSVTELLAPTAI
jgi:transposase